MVEIKILDQQHGCDCCEYVFHFPSAFNSSAVLAPCWGAAINRI